MKKGKEPKHLPFNGDDEEFTWLEMIFSVLVLIAVVGWLMLMTMWMAILT